MNDPLPFADGSFDAVVSRLSLMIARDPAATLADERRLLRPGGRIVTAVWAEVPANAWFGHPRTAVANALGPDRARFARRFGQLGTADELASVHRAGGFTGVEVEVVADALEFASPAAHWRSMVSTIGQLRAAGRNPQARRARGGDRRARPDHRGSAGALANAADRPRAEG